MSTIDEEARALRLVWELLLDISSGAEKNIPTATRKRARQAMRHYPLGADARWEDLHREGLQNPSTTR